MMNIATETKTAAEVEKKVQLAFDVTSYQYRYQRANLLSCMELMGHGLVAKQLSFSSNTTNGAKEFKYILDISGIDSSDRESFIDNLLTNLRNSKVASSDILVRDLPDQSQLSRERLPVANEDDVALVS